MCRHLQRKERICLGSVVGFFWVSARQAATQARSAATGNVRVAVADAGANERSERSDGRRIAAADRRKTERFFPEKIGKILRQFLR